MSALRQLLLRFFKVPPEPEPPPGTPASVTAFRASRRYFHYLLLEWAVKQVGALIGIVLGLTFVSGLEETLWSAWAPPLRLVEFLAVAFYVLQLVVTPLFVRLRWELRWYLVSDRSLRLREGLFRLWEQTMTVANIQNMKVTQGPVQKLFGIADLEVHTAGGGSTPEQQGGVSAQRNLHVGRFRGLDNAKAVRNQIREALRRQRGSGLGDPDEPHHELPPRAVGAEPATRGVASRGAQAAALLAAGQELIRQSRALRAELAE